LNIRLFLFKRLLQEQDKNFSEKSLAEQFEVIRAVYGLKKEQLRMKTKVILFLVLFMSSSVYCQEEQKKLDIFMGRLKEAVEKKDRKLLKKIFYPKKNLDYSLYDNKKIQYIYKRDEWIEKVDFDLLKMIINQGSYELVRKDTISLPGISKIEGHCLYLEVQFYDEQKEWKILEILKKNPINPIKDFEVFWKLLNKAVEQKDKELLKNLLSERGTPWTDPHFRFRQRAILSKDVIAEIVDWEFLKKMISLGYEFVQREGEAFAENHYYGWDEIISPPRQYIPSKMMHYIVISNLYNDGYKLSSFEWHDTTD